MADLTEGATGPQVEHGPLSRTDFVRYAGASNDFNPIHHDDGFAQRAGQPSVFGHGMFSAGLLASYVVGWVGAGAVTGFKVRFVDRVWPGDVVVPVGRVTATDDEAGTATIELELQRDGDVLVTGAAHVRTDQGKA